MTCILACSLRLTNHIHTPHTLSLFTAGSPTAEGPHLEQSDLSAGWG